MASRIDSSQNRNLYVGTGTEVAVNDGNAIVTGNVGLERLVQLLNFKQFKPQQIGLGDLKITRQTHLVLEWIYLEVQE